MGQKQNRNRRIFDFEIDTKDMQERPRVDHLIEAGINKPITLIHAPSGYGKTTAAVQYIRSCPHQAVFMSLTELDSDTKRFWSRLCSIYAQLDKNVGEKMSRMDFPVSNTDIQQFAEFLMDLSAIGKHILVLDDYHAAESPELSNLIVKLASLRLNGLCIMLISRKLPKFCGIDMKVKGLLCEINRDQLRYDITEIIDYYGRENKEVDTELAQKISEYTEGWPSAIYLSRSYIHSIAGRKNAIPDLDIDRMIEYTIYNGYPDEVKEFLLKLCILDRFDLELAAYITASKNTYDLITLIITENSLIKVSEDKQFYSMHSLLREFLRKKLTSADANQINELHTKAGDYYAYRDDMLPALFHYEQAGNYSKLAGLILQSKYMRIFANQEFNTVIAYMDKIPASVYEEHPMLWLILAHAYTYTNQAAKSVDIIEKVSAMCESYDMTDQQRNELKGEILMIRLMLSFNDYNAMLSYAREAARLLPNGTSLISPKGSYTFGNPTIIYSFYNRKGGLDDAVRAFVEEFPVWERVSELGTGADYQMKAEAEFERCDYENAESDAYRAINKALTKKQTSVVVAGKMLTVKLCAARGKYNAAANAFRELRDYIRRDDSTVYRFTLELCEAAYALLWGSVDDVPKWLVSGEFISDGMTRMTAGMEHLIHAHVLLFQEDYIRLESIIPVMLKLYDVFHNQYGIIRANLAGAVAAYHLYGLDKAIPFLRAAFEISEADRLVMPYLEYGEFLLPLLKEAAEQNDMLDLPVPVKTLELLMKRMREYGAALQKARGGYLAEHPGRTAFGGIKLTKRETEILELIIQGLNGDEIAEKLFVTPINIRVITSKIYRKLGVSSRSEAVRVAMDNRLVK